MQILRKTRNCIRRTQFQPIVALDRNRTHNPSVKHLLTNFDPNLVHKTLFTRSMFKYKIVASLAKTLARLYKTGGK